MLSRSPEDEKIISEIINLVKENIGKHKKITYDNIKLQNAYLHIYDARPYINALAQRVYFNVGGR